MKIGNTEVSKIGQGSTFGGKKLGRKTKLLILEYGLDKGINLVDSGEDYEGGIAEEIVGEFLKGKRDKVFVSTKFIPRNNDKVIQSCEGSLRRLRTDYIDLYQMQWANYEVPFEVTLEQLETLKRQGKIRYWGVCNLTFGEFKNTNSVSIQTEFSLSNREVEKELLPYCLNNSRTLIGYNIFNQGYLEPSKVEFLLPFTWKYSRNIYQIILAWAISKGILVLTNTTNLVHLQRNIEATELKLDREDIALIDKSYNPPIEIPVEQIGIVPETVDDSHKVYTTLKEVLENADRIHPNPFVLAKEIKENGLLKPIEVKRTEKGYQIIHGSARYFSWIIAFGSKPIPCFVI